jgi:hypothetical protein
MKKVAITLFWYFMVAGPNVLNSAAVISSQTLEAPPITEGPFDSKAQCDQLRDWAIKNKTFGANILINASQCWEVKNESR